jgi:hypothetical protein
MRCFFISLDVNCVDRDRKPAASSPLRCAMNKSKKECGKKVLTLSEFKIEVTKKSLKLK